MNREIIFRGKRIDNGKWVDGDLVHYTSGDVVIYATFFNELESCEAIGINKINPETVGQYTGLKDSTGKRIFEGDIVKVRDPYNGCWSVNGGEVIFSTEYVGGWVLTSNGKDGLNIGTRTNNIKIIGNIHDSPELLVTE